VISFALLSLPISLSSRSARPGVGGDRALYGRQRRDPAIGRRAGGASVNASLQLLWRPAS
jgi:hypothetical protein